MRVNASAPSEFSRARHTAGVRLPRIEWENIPQRKQLDENVLGPIHRLDGANAQKPIHARLKG